MSIDVTGVNEAANLTAPSGQKQKISFQNLGTAEDPLSGPVLVQGRATKDYFWSQGEVGIFRASDMISELTLVDTSGGVTSAMQRMSRQTGRGMDLFGGVNRNYFTVSVPSSEYLTEAGSVTYRVRYHDGSTEDVTFHMAPPDSAKQDKSIQKLSGADVVAQDQVAVVLDGIVPEVSPADKAAKPVQVESRNRGAFAAGDATVPATVAAAGTNAVEGSRGRSTALRELETVALTSQEQWFRSYHLLTTMTESGTFG